MTWPKPYDIKPEDWENLKKLLGPREEDFVERYKDIEQKLVRFFTWKGSVVPDELAFVTLSRVAKKCKDLPNPFEDDPLAYCYGVAKNVFLESIREPRWGLPAPAPDPPEVKEAMQECLDQCMTKTLKPEERKLIVDYYRGERGGKIRARKKMAEVLEMTTNALRIKIHRIRERLGVCVLECAEAKGLR
jgi:DNA-directed RNA polymerase specialized sigma24 family protein